MIHDKGLQERGSRSSRAGKGDIWGGEMSTMEAECGSFSPRGWWERTVLVTAASPAAAGPDPASSPRHDSSNTEPF
ncbi:hypothetical protein PBY51_011186 [Eleginops maclovinus]|uniref:Uncharacterized protein n=1 Tax=Eleginops maclovinus TaxID=56733 RepID=A0AAN8AK86_ELEMC|nr:hypothetical protein PBY51_011186 [Eleginops maclovinus]